MTIDEEKEFCLTNFKPAVKGHKANDSDHHSIIVFSVMLIDGD